MVMVFGDMATTAAGMAAETAERLTTVEKQKKERDDLAKSVKFGPKKTVANKPKAHKSINRKKVASSPVGEPEKAVSEQKEELKTETETHERVQKTVNGHPVEFYIPKSLPRNPNFCFNRHGAGGGGGDEKYFSGLDGRYSGNLDANTVYAFPYVPGRFPAKEFTDMVQQVKADLLTRPDIDQFNKTIFSGHSYAGIDIANWIKFSPESAELFASADLVLNDVIFTDGLIDFLASERFTGNLVVNSVKAVVRNHGTMMPKLIRALKERYPAGVVEEKDGVPISFTYKELDRFINVQYDLEPEEKHWAGHAAAEADGFAVYNAEMGNDANLENREEPVEYAEKSMPQERETYSDGTYYEETVPTTGAEAFNLPDRKPIKSGSRILEYPVGIDQDYADILAGYDYNEGLIYMEDPDVKDANGEIMHCPLPETPARLINKLNEEIAKYGYKIAVGAGIRNEEQQRTAIKENLANGGVLGRDIAPVGGTNHHKFAVDVCLLKQVDGKWVEVVEAPRNGVGAAKLMNGKYQNPGTGLQNEINTLAAFMNSIGMSRYSYEPWHFEFNQATLNRLVRTGLLQGDGANFAKQYRGYPYRGKDSLDDHGHEHR